MQAQRIADRVRLSRLRLYGARRYTMASTAMLWVELLRDARSPSPHIPSFFRKSSAFGAYMERVVAVSR